MGFWLCDTAVMNIILKGFDDGSGKPIVERALSGISIRTCISILNDKKQWPEIHAKEHIWMSAKLLRAGLYPDVDWSQVTPLDEEVMQSMRNTECVFLSMVERYAKYAEMPYRERLRQYLEHLRYWNHILETRKIDVLLMNTVPHQCYDIVIYDLCKKKNIPVHYIERMVHFGVCTIESDWEKAGEEISAHYQELRVGYADGRDVPLSPSLENYFKTYSEIDRGPWYMKGHKLIPERKSFLQNWVGIAAHILIHKPRYFFRSVFSPAFWKRKLDQHRTIRLYDRSTKLPDLTKPYIYVPLHLQPEASTNPLGGVFTDQALVVQMLAGSLPPGIRIYVKEHPWQSEVCRSAAFYESLKAIPSVTLVPRHFDTFQLTHHALAIASVTGTAMLEGLFRCKPAIMFGHLYFQYAPGVFPVQNQEECAAAIQTILEKRTVHTLRDMRVFLKAIEESACPYAGAPEDPHVPLSRIQKAELMGEAIAERLGNVYRRSET